MSAPSCAAGSTAPILLSALGALIAGLWPGSATAASATGHVSVTILPVAGAVTESAAMSAEATGHVRDQLPLAGAFTLSGPPYTVVTLSLAPGGPPVGAAAGVTLAALTHNAGPSPSLSATGTLRVLVKARAALGPGPASSYSGSYGVTVNY